MDYGGGVNVVVLGYSIGIGLVVEIIGIFVLMFIVFFVMDFKCKVCDFYVLVSLIWGLFV